MKVRGGTATVASLQMHILERGKRSLLDMNRWILIYQKAYRLRSSGTRRFVVSDQGVQRHLALWFRPT